jgi:YihY family inner membrane protein
VAPRALVKLDELQQGKPTAALVFGVAKKFGDDRGGSLAALIAYYGFFSLFPLLLAFVTITTFVIRGNQALQQRILDSALSQFPIVGTKIGHTVHALQGSVLALVVGVAGALWSGLAVVGAFRTAMDEIWNVPRRLGASFITRLWKGLVTLVALGVVISISAFLAGLGTTSGAGAVLRVVAFLAASAVDVALFALAFRLLTAADLSWRDVLPGAVLAAAAWIGLQSIGVYLVDQQIRGASNVYGFFAIVIGLLSWIFLAAQVVLFCAEVNVVLKGRLWPRRLSVPPTTSADRRSLAGEVKEEEAASDETVDVTFEDNRGDVYRPDGSGNP